MAYMEVCMCELVARAVDTGKLVNGKGQQSRTANEAGLKWEGIEIRQKQE